MTTRLPNEDRSIPLIVAPSMFCPRKLRNDGVTPSVKRYMSKGPLFGFMVCCPACGFIELHQHDHVRFVEEDGALVSVEKPMRCLACNRVISIAGGVVLAISPMSLRGR